MTNLKLEGDAQNLRKENSCGPTRSDSEQTLHHLFSRRINANHKFHVTSYLPNGLGGVEQIDHNVNVVQHDLNYAFETTL